MIHDDLDLPPGHPSQAGRRQRGHNGLKDIQARLGTPDFWRPGWASAIPAAWASHQAVVDFVLHPPAKCRRTTWTIAVWLPLSAGAGAA